MIIDKDIHPQHKIYYWGALVIDILNRSPESIVSYFSVYEELKQNYGVSVETFSLTLDWLFILGAIEGSEGDIKKCF